MSGYFIGSKVPYERLSLHGFQQEETTGLESFVHLLEHLLVLLLVFQVAKGSEDVDYRVEFILEGIIPLIAFHPAYLPALSLSVAPRIIHAPLTQIPPLTL